MALVDGTDHQVLVRFFGGRRVGRRVEASKELRGPDLRCLDALLGLNEVTIVPVIRWVTL